MSFHGHSERQRRIPSTAVSFHGHSERSEESHPMHMKNYYVYIATNKNNNVLYTGVTSNIDRRILEHQFKINSKSFTARYNINKIVFLETFNNPKDAIFAEKTIKGWTRDKKIKIIEEQNPQWKDLAV